MTDDDPTIIVDFVENNKVNWNSIISMFAIVLAMLLIAIAKFLQTWLKKKIGENKLEFVRSSSNQLPITPSIAVEPSQTSSEKN